MVIGRWDIYWANLNPAVGSEQMGQRPVLVVSADEANAVLPVVTVVSLTSLKPGRKVYPIEALLTRQATGLSKDSIAMAHQIRSISKERLGERCGYVESAEARDAVARAMRLYLDLG